MKIAISRRHFLKAASAGVLAANLPLLAWRTSAVANASPPLRPRFFTDPKAYATLQDLTDRVIPPDTDPKGMPSPGGEAAGVADYIDFLLGAFLSSEPFILAGGPFSDRNPFNGQGFTDDMAKPMKPTPNQALAWRIRILGTIGAAAANPADRAKIDIVTANNKIVGLGDAKGDLPGFQTLYTEGIKGLRQLAEMMFGKDFPDLSPAEQDQVIGSAEPNFIALVTGHTGEGMYGNPEYGGNQPPDRSRPATGADGDNRPIGWVIADFEGDRQPRGYTFFDPATHTSVEDPNHPVSTPNPADPPQMDARTAEILRQFADRWRRRTRR